MEVSPTDPYAYGNLAGLPDVNGVGPWMQNLASDPYAYGNLKGLPVVNGVGPWLQNLDITKIDNLTIGPGAHVSTPGATVTQAASLYGAFAQGDVQAHSTGHNTVGYTAGGALTAAKGIFNAEKGIMNDYSNKLVLMI